MGYWTIGIAFGVGLLLGQLLGAPGLVIAVIAVAVAIGGWLLQRTRSGQRAADAVGARQAIELEISRARRVERPVSLVRVSASEITADAWQGLLARLRSILRDIDSVWWLDPHLFVLLSETPKSGARTLMARLQSVIPAGASWSIAEFPGDGLTLDALLASLDEGVRSGAAVEASDGAA